MKKNLKVAIFDVDGLILDSEAFYAKAWADAFNSNSRKEYRVDEDLMIEWFYRNISGKNIKEQLDKIQNEYKNNDIQTIYQEYQKLFTERLKNQAIDIRKGFFELLDYLKKNNIRLAIASTSKESAIKDAFKNANIDISAFEVLVTGDMMLEAKPNPAPYLKACQLLGVDFNDAIAFEDSESGLLSASGANIKCFLIPGRAVVNEEIQKRAFAVCDSLFDVISIIEREFSLDITR